MKCKRLTCLLAAGFLTLALFSPIAGASSLDSESDSEIVAEIAAAGDSTVSQTKGGETVAFWAVLGASLLYCGVLFCSYKRNA